MARITLKEGADPLKIGEELAQAGITMGRRLPDGRYVAYVNKRIWLCQQYPELIPVYQEDRAFWRNVRKRCRNGEDVPREELQAHAKKFKEQLNEIIDQHEREE